MADSFSKVFSAGGPVYLQLPANQAVSRTVPNFYPTFTRALERAGNSTTAAADVLQALRRVLQSPTKTRRPRLGRVASDSPTAVAGSPFYPLA
jgi:hypothetical protein